MISVVIERSWENLQVAWLYESEDVARNMANRLFENWFLIDYDVLSFSDYWELNHYLQWEIVLPDVNS